MSVKTELEKICAAHRGRLHPKDVVEFARDPTTALHSQFEWDDSEAAAKYRLQQAAEVIRCTVIMIPNDSSPIRAYVSLSTDQRSHGGYRTIAAVLSDDDLRAQLIADAKADLEAFTRRYQRLKDSRELAKVFRAIKEATAKKKRV